MSASFVLLSINSEICLLTKIICTQALELHGRALLGRDIRLDLAAERGD